MQFLGNYLLGIHPQCLGLAVTVHLLGAPVPGGDFPIKVVDGDGIVRIQQDRGQALRLLVGLPDLSHVGEREDHPFDVVVQRPVRGDAPDPPAAVRGLHLLLLRGQGAEHLLDFLLERGIRAFGRDVADGPTDVRARSS